MARLLLGDCREQLKTLADNSVDSVVTDPPYELGFMGKAWDNSGIAYDVGMWREVMRVLKPGGHLLAFGGTRTYHRMACAIEDAGFEIRDQMQWLYGSGFPKSLDVSKAIDKAAGAKRIAGGVKPGHEGFANRGNMTSVQSLKGTLGGEGGFARPWMDDPEKVERYHMATVPSTKEAQAWLGWGTALKPANEPICVARKPLSESTVAKNVLEHGTGAINIDGCRVDGAMKGDPARFQKTDGGSFVSFKTPPVVRTSGRWPANVVLSHSDGCRLVGTRQVKGNPGGTLQPVKSSKGIAGGQFGNPSALKPDGHEKSSAIRPNHADADGTETVEKWECEEGCAVRMLDEQSVDRKSGGKVSGTEPSRTGDNGIYSSWGRVENAPFNDTGGASRFFYCAKASRSERNAGCENLPYEWTPGKEPSTNRTDETEPIKIYDGSSTSTRGTTTPNRGNTHATVKPVKLMAYLCRLVTPPGGTVLDPFMGSGTTGIAAIQGGFSFIGIEREPDYMEIAKARIAHAEKEKEDEQPQLLAA